MYTNVYPREKYLSKIRPFFDSDIIKVITGIRRCGKSFILKSIINELLSKGVNEKQIIYIPLDKRGYKNIKKPEQLEEEIENKITNESFYYIFVDEVQNVIGFESVIQAYAEEGWSIFLTGSNSYLLSDEITTKLTGRFLKFETYTLDFQEYIDFKKFKHLPINEDMYKEFDEYILNGGFPKSLEFKEIKDRRTYTKGIIEEIFEKDVKKRNKIRNPMAYERVQSFLINNYSSKFSLSGLIKHFESASLKVLPKTLKKYIDDLLKAKIIYECNCFDLKSNKSIKREQKYYLADLAIYFSANVDNQMNYGPSLENIIYIYLKGKDYEVSVGKIGNFECDFIIRKPDGDYAYIQVTYTLHGEDERTTQKIKEREYRSFRSITNGYPRYVISLDRYLDQQEGVKHINVIDLLLGKEII